MRIVPICPENRISTKGNTSGSANLKKTQDAAAIRVPVEPLRTVQWDINSLAGHSLYLMHIAIDKGVSDYIKLDYQDFGATQEEVLHTKSTDRVQEVKIEGFKRLNKAYNILKARRTTLQSKSGFLKRCIGDLWFCPEMFVEEVDKEVEAMQAIAQSELDVCLEADLFEQERIACCERIFSHLKQYQIPGRLSHKELRDRVFSEDLLEDGRLSYYLRFPKREVIRETFGVHAVWQQRIKSLEESAQEEAGLKAALAENYKARAASEAEEAALQLQRKRLEMQLRIERDNQAQLGNACHQLVRNVQAEVFVKIQESLDFVEKAHAELNGLPINGLPIKGRKDFKASIQARLDDLQRLEVFAKTLGSMDYYADISPDLAAIMAECQRADDTLLTLNFADFNRRMGELRDRLDQIKAAGTTGREALTFQGILL